MLKHLLNMFFANNFEAGDDESEIKVRSLLLQFVDHLSNNLQLCDVVHLLLIIVEQNTLNVSIPDDENILLYVRFEGLAK